jgi:hypothetical protein
MKKQSKPNNIRKPVPKWTFEGTTIGAYTKSEVRAILKRVLSKARERNVRLPVGTGKKIVKQRASNETAN